MFMLQWAVADSTVRRSPSCPVYPPAQPCTVSLKAVVLDLDSFAQGLEHQPADQRVAGSIPSQGHIPELQVQSSALIQGVGWDGGEYGNSLPMTFPLKPNS